MTKSRDIPVEFLETMAGKFRLLGDSTRLAILRSLMVGGELTVGLIVERSDRSLANVSKHLKLLAGAGFVARRKEGASVYYKIDDPTVHQICNLVCNSVFDRMRKDQKQQSKLLRKRGN